MENKKPENKTPDLKAAYDKVDAALMALLDNTDGNLNAILLHRYNKAVYDYRLAAGAFDPEAVALADAAFNA